MLAELPSYFIFLVNVLKNIYSNLQFTPFNLQASSLLQLCHIKTFTPFYQLFLVQNSFRASSCQYDKINHESMVVNLIVSYQNTFLFINLFRLRTIFEHLHISTVNSTKNQRQIVPLTRWYLATRSAIVSRHEAFRMANGSRDIKRCSKAHGEPLLLHRSQQRRRMFALRRPLLFLLFTSFSRAVENPLDLNSMILTKCPSVLRAPV